MDFITKIFSGFFILVSIFAVLMILDSGMNPSVTLTSRNFTSNNTWYPMSKQPNNGDLYLYYFGNTTFQIPSNRYEYNASHIKILANFTWVNDTYPLWGNVTTNKFYYYSYTYQTRLITWDTDLTFILVIVVMALGFLSAIAWIRYSKIK